MLTVLATASVHMRGDWRAAAYNRSKQGQRFLESDIPSGVKALRCTWQISPTMLSNCPANSVQCIGRATCAAIYGRCQVISKAFKA